MDVVLSFRVWIATRARWPLGFHRRQAPGRMPQRKAEAYAAGDGGGCCPTLRSKALRLARAKLGDTFTSDACRRSKPSQPHSIQNICAFRPGLKPSGRVWARVDIIPCSSQILSHSTNMSVPPRCNARKPAESRPSGAGAFEPRRRLMDAPSKSA